MTQNSQNKFTAIPCAKFELEGCMEFVGDFMRFLIDEKIHTLRGGACGPGFWIGIIHKEDVDRCVQWLNDHYDDPKYSPQL